MYCPYCGVSNPYDATYCRACGKQMPSLTTSMKCPFCGADKQEYQLYCSKCGKELPKERKLEPVSGRVTTPAEPKPKPVTVEAVVAAPPPPITARPCPICGRPMTIYATQCDYCSRPEADYSREPSDWRYTRETEMPQIGGALILISAILGLLTGLSVLAGVASMGTNDWGGTCCGGLIIIFSFIAFAGSFSAIGRKNGMIAIIGGIFGILSIGFFLGAVLALVGVILVAISYNEFSE